MTVVKYIRTLYGLGYLSWHPPTITKHSGGFIADIQKNIFLLVHAHYTVYTATQPLLFLMLNAELVER